MLAVLADSPSLAGFQKKDAVEFAPQIRDSLELVLTEEFRNPEYSANGPGPLLSLQGRVV